MSVDKEPLGVFGVLLRVQPRQCSNRPALIVLAFTGWQPVLQVFDQQADSAVVAVPREGETIPLPRKTNHAVQKPAFNQSAHRQVLAQTYQPGSRERLSPGSALEPAGELLGRNEGRGLEEVFSKGSELRSLRRQKVGMKQQQVDFLPVVLPPILLRQGWGICHLGSV